MTFIEWIKDSGIEINDATVNGAEFIWNAATQAERERIDARKAESEAATIEAQDIGTNLGAKLLAMTQQKAELVKKWRERIANARVDAAYNFEAGKQDGRLAGIRECADELEGLK